MQDRPRIPGEWEPHAACWLAFPYLSDEWPGGLREAQKSIAALCRAIAGPGGEPVRLLVHGPDVEATARSMVGAGSDVDYVQADYGDCWLRDTVPLLGHDAKGHLAGLRFELNGWGGKYDIPLDDRVADEVLRATGARASHVGLVLEGGAIETNGRGLVLTTESCALNPNRNPGLSRDRFEEALRAGIAVERVVWIDRGLRHDHTDGHVDMIARFSSERTVLCMRPDGDVPNADILQAVRTEIADAGLEVVDVPAPAEVVAPDGSPLPATYCNFYVANEAVIVPTYGVPQDDDAMAAIGAAFPDREPIGLPGRDLLCGGGVFHCVTQPEPASP